MFTPLLLPSYLKAHCFVPLILPLNLQVFELLSIVLHPLEMHCPLEMAGTCHMALLNT